MKHLVFLLEEESAKALLENLLPRIFQNITFKCIPFEGKSDLEGNFVKKLKGYNVPNTFFVILRDQDSADCYVIKNNLKEKCVDASKPDTLIRIACQELESWYFGSLVSVEKVLNISNLSHYSIDKRYRIPDSIVNPKQELKKITNQKYRQVSSSREIGNIMDYRNNTSKSFNVFIEGLKRIIE
ncbi:MAG: hypothetical protein HW421_373 [Ignavibacteria bacterium]|nr:hypothetical protein [Ignavibacteria bacterium]